MSVYKQTAAVSATAALLLIIVLSAQGWSHSDSSPTVLVAPGHWESPNPWVIDPNEYATTFSGDWGALDEFFSEEPNLFAKGNGDDYEWPYTWAGDGGTGIGGGYDWLGSETSVRARGLDMPPDFDLYGEKYRSRQSAADKYHSAMSTQTPTYFSAPAGQTVHSRQSRLAVVNGQILRSTYTDYGLGGAGVKCVCDADAAGDEEMEGLDPKVKPTCVCKGGRLTSTTGTEQGGPLDSGAQGAWPQALPNKVSYIDGGSAAAYANGGHRSWLKARTSVLYGLPEVGLNVHDVKTEFPHKKVIVGREGLRWHDGEEGEEGSQAEGGEGGLKKGANGGERETEVTASAEEGDESEAVQEEGPEGLEGGKGQAEGAEDFEQVVEKEKTLNELMAENRLGPHDQRLAHRIRQCADGKLCICNKQAGRHLCNRLSAEKDACDVSPEKMLPDSTSLQFCEHSAVVAALKMCPDVVRLPGVVVDQNPIDDYLEALPADYSTPNLWIPEDGVHE